MSAAAEVAVAPPSSRPVTRGWPWGAALRMALADFAARTRQPGHMVALLVMAWITNGMLPPQRADYRTFTMVDGFRPAYGADWVGALVAMLTSVYFLFVGFYLVRGGIERDRHGGVGQVLAATRMTRLGYVASKAISNALVLGSMIVVAAVVALLSQQLLGEDRRVDLIASLLPFVLLTVPVALFVAAAAVAFDATPVLRGGAGNVAWFFLLAAVMSASALDSPSSGRTLMDLIGGRSVASVAFADLYAAFPDAPRGEQSLSMGVNVSPRWKGKELRTFRWSGMHWSGDVLFTRLFWVLVACALLGLACMVFDRFAGVRAAPGAGRAPPWARWPAWRSRRRAVLATGIAHARAVSVARSSFAWTALLRAELQLLVRGMPAWWFAGAAGLWIAGCFAPLGALRAAWLPVASFWPVFAWSALGSRERRFDTAGVLFPVSRPLLRMLPAAWVAGAVVMLLIGSSGVARLALSGDVAAPAGWTLGGFTVSGLALALGVWSGSGKFFEAAYLFLWYLGPMHHLAEFDYTGVTAPRSAGLWIAHAAAAGLLFAAACAGRARQIQR